MTHISRLLLGLTALGMLVSCSDKNDPKPLPDLSSMKTYTGNNLELYYNDELMPGKTADVTLKGDNIDLKFSSSFDLSQLSGMGLTGALPGPGVTPGNPVLNLSVSATGSGGAYVFAGSGSTDYVSFNYSGSIESDKMVFKISESKLKNIVFAGNVFAPAPIEKNGLLNYTSLPFHLVWELDPVTGIDIPLSDILKVIVTAPVIPVYNNTAYTSVAEAFVSLVKTIALTDSGNVPVMYISTLGGAAHLATSSGNMMQYVPTESGIRLYINPLSAVSQVLLATSNNKNDEKFDFEQMLKKAPSSSDTSAGDENAVGMDPALSKAFIEVLLKAIAPQVSGGIPLSVSPTAKGAEIYLDTETSVTFLATLLQDALSDPVIMGALQKALGSVELPNVSPEELAGIIQKLPQFLTATTKLEIGLSLVKAS